MPDLQYSINYDSKLGLYPWQVALGRRLLATLPRVVALGGGTGLPIVLKGLKAAFFPAGSTWVEARDRDRITAVVTVADDGGSSGRLRNAYNVLPPGDIRNCLLALSDVSPTLAAIFNFRFQGEVEMGDHSLGNLILTALSLSERDFCKAVERGSEILRVRGRVLPATAERVTLRAEFTDGSCIQGESQIASVRRPIQKVKLEPEESPALPQAREAIAAADLVVIGPGSLYTSLIPVLLAKGLAEAIAGSHARVVLVMNLMTEPGETDGYTAADHLLAIRRHAPQLPIHDVLLNAAPISREMTERYAAESAVPVSDGIDLGCRPVKRDLLEVGPKVRHDTHKLAQAVLELAMEG